MLFINVLSLPQLPKKYDQVQFLSEASPEGLRSIEIAIQISTFVEYDTLSVEEISEICQLNLPPLERDSLYFCWHQIWFQLSRNGGKLYLPLEYLEVVHDFFEVHPCQESGKMQFNEKSKRHEFLKSLHMMIVEWIVHSPGFDCRGMLLGEALDFFCEKAGLTPLHNVLPFDIAELKVEQSINLLNFLFSRDGNL